MPVVVSDTLPVRALEHLARLDWLQQLFGEVFLPPAVAAELRQPAGSFKPLEISTWPYLQVRAPKNAARVAILRSSLDAGEAEAIALAEEIGADVVVIDEQAGRDVARRVGFTVVGTLGILLEAKHRGICPAVKPLLVRLQTELRFFVSAKLSQAILREAEEDS